MQPVAQPHAYARLLRSSSQPDDHEWDEIEAIQVAESAANVALTFSRYNVDGDVVSTFNTLYLVTNDNGRWGVLARSSFAP